MASLGNKAAAAVAGLVAGVGVIAGGTTVVKNLPAPEFSMDRERFDQSTFQGRYGLGLDKR